jgi:hypothetical protein
MQIDFHHTATYVIARSAGIDHDTARIIAHASQYVDDATNDGEIFFNDDVRLYRRLSSAHRTLDYRNLQNLKNNICWIPFHFLPGNCGKAAGETVSANIEDRLICLPNSPVAQDMMRATFLDRDKPRGPHRLGIAAHVFKDTFAHQQFAGINHRVNEVNDLLWHDPSDDDAAKRDEIFEEKQKNTLGARLKSWWKTDASQYGGGYAKLKALAQNIVQSTIPTLGHGQALSYPDRPYIAWHYRNGKGEIVERNNPRDFMTASDELCKWCQRWKDNDPNADVPGLSDDIREKMKALIHEAKAPDGEVRHEAWLKRLKDDYFGFGKVDLTYVGKGEGSWKDRALGSKVDLVRGEEKYPYKEAFLESDWKLFHDAAKAHRLAILDDILPQYGIVAA